MKNPWMSLWLSNANKAPNTARGLWLAEAQRRQQAFAREMAKAWGLAPAARKKRGSGGSGRGSRFRFEGMIYAGFLNVHRM
jgi:hypothetical protein